LAAHTPVPAVVWAGLWSLVSIAILGWGAVFSLRSRPGPKSGLAPVSDPI
jgi:hypothetical protein